MSQSALTLAPEIQQYFVSRELSPTSSVLPPGCPSVSVIVRSYQRPQALLELVERLLKQDYPAFEVVVFEQSNDSDLLDRLASFKAPDLCVVAAPPTNAPAARNAAIRHSRGDILVFIDDDDLPIGEAWISGHVRNYEDVLCMGVVGRLVSDPTRMQGPRFPKLVRLLAMRHTLFKDTRAYAHNTLEKKGIDFLIGSNSSVRRSLVRRIGGWDEGIPMNEEQSFAFKFARMKLKGEYFKFDPTPMMWRRTNIKGGLARREAEGWHLREIEARLFYYKHVVGHYFPIRYALLRPLFVLRALTQVLEWIWDPDNGERTTRERARASIDLFLGVFRWVFSRRFSEGEIRRVTSCI